jgi:hypothetical protein
VNIFTDQKILIPGYSSFYNTATTRFSGTAIYVSNLWTVTAHPVLAESKLQKVTISDPNGGEVSVYNCHLPHNNNDALAIVNIMEADIDSNPNSTPILVGDWNYVDNIHLDYRNHTSDRPSVRFRMKQLLYNYALLDTFRFLHPARVAMTHTGVHQHNPQGRLDRIYIPGSFSRYLQSAEILPSFSDHAIVSTSLHFGNVSKCRTWKLNINILRNSDFKLEVKQLLDSYAQKEKIDFRSYEVLKFQIKKIALESENVMKYVRRQEYRNILYSFALDSTNSKELFRQMIEAEGSDLQNLDPDFQKKKLPAARGEISLNTAFAEFSKDDRTDYFYKFYEKMLQKDILGYEGINEFLQGLPQVSSDAVEIMESQIELEEVEEAIKSLQPSTCPGLDGINAEFYKIFKEQMGPILVSLWNECMTEGILPRSLRQGIVTLIYKNKGDPKSLRNWRPITMSNCDFKIYAIILKNRLATQLGKLIGPWQTCGVAGRSIFDNLSFLRENLGSGDGALLSLDQENAFGNVDHTYMLNTLKAFGFPNRFVNFIQIMYNSNFVHINTGLSITKAIPLEKGVKQGDPMASSLFLLCLEPLLRRLSRRMLETAPSPFLDSPNTNLSTYADDTTPIISHLDQFPVIEEELHNYGKVSGGRVNWSKCEVFPFGSWKQLQLPTQYKSAPNGLKILGIYFGDLVYKNWEDLLSKVRTKLALYKSKSNCTSLSSKVKLLNTFILPIIWYVLKVLDPPRDFIVQIQRECEEYLWEQKRHWVKRSMTHAPQPNGGLGLKSPLVQIIIFRLRALGKAQSPQCSKYFLQKLISHSNDIIFENRHNSDPNLESLRLTIIKMNFTFFLLPSQLAYNRLHLKNEVVFGSSGFPVLESIGISTAGEVELLLSSTARPDIPERRVRKLNAETRAYKVKKSTFLNSLKPSDYDSDPNSIHTPLFRAYDPILGEIVEVTEENDYLVCFFGLFAFESFSAQDQQKLKSKKWERLKGTKLSSLEIDIVWRIWNSCVLTYKIAQRMGLVSSGNCAFCSQQNPNCLHMVFCNSAEPLWTYVWDRIGKMGIRVGRKERIFGYDGSNLLNSVIFLALVVLYRRFLYNVNSGKIVYDLVNTYKELLKEKIYIEYIIAKSNNMVPTFPASWGDGVGLFELNGDILEIKLD